jgi:hypothetical protein
MFFFNKRHSIAAIIFFFILIGEADAQFVPTDGIKGKWEKILKSEKISVLGNLGLGTYFGDVCDNFDCMQLRPNIGIGATFRITDNFSNKTEINYFRLYSDDTWERRNLGFRSDNLEIYTAVMYDLFAYQKRFAFRNKINPYLFAGIGVAFYSPKAEIDGQWHNLRPMETEGLRYGTATPIIPLGVGIRYAYSRSIEFIAEGAYRITFTDYLDDVSGFKFVEADKFEDPIARQLSNRSNVANSETWQRGNPNSNDGYFLAQIKVRYIFSKVPPLMNQNIPGLRRKL